MNPSHPLLDAQRSLIAECRKANDPSLSPLIDHLVKRLPAVVEAIEKTAATEERLVVAQAKHTASTARLKHTSGVVMYGTDDPELALKHHQENVVAQAAFAASRRELESATHAALTGDRLKKFTHDSAMIAAQQSTADLAAQVEDQWSKVKGLAITQSSAVESTVEQRMWWPYFELKEIKARPNAKCQALLVKLFAERRNAVERHAQNLIQQSESARTAAAKFAPTVTP